MSVKIFHNPRCRKSRAGLAKLQSLTGSYEIVDYIKDGLKKEDVKLILKSSGMNIMQIIRTQEEFYRKQLKNKNLSQDEWLQTIADNPKLLQRPFVVLNGKAVLGDPPENIEELF
jgi:arsenate reductase (glutaredoxin)